MAFTRTTALEKIHALTKRIRIIQGGSSAGKTIAILIILIDLAQREEGQLISVVSETVPHLKRGAIRDFLSIMEGQGDYKDASWNRTDFIYTFETGSRIEFFSADTPDKVRGPRRDHLFINEANHLPYETYVQLAIRTSGTIWIDFNPVAEFWAHEQIDAKPDIDNDFIVLTYKDNEALSPEIVKEIESRKGNRNFWQVYGLGQIGIAEGVIFPNWKPIDELPKEARLLRRWLDYGYTNDPTAIGGIYKWNDSYILNEEVYQKGLSNKQITDLILNQEEQVPVAADSAEPKSNDELTSYGLTVIPARKGKDSINNGIALVQDQKIFVTKRSVNILKERANYLWDTDKTGKPINVPVPIWNHHMDGIRYGFESLIGTVPESVQQAQQEHMNMNQHRTILNATK